MKPLSEIAIEKIPDAFDPDEILPARAGHLVNLERRGFIAGANWMRTELLRWRDPKIEVPDDSMRVIVCAQLPNGARLITGGWYGREPGEAGWNIDIDNWPELEVVGWRPIEHK